MVHKLSEKEWKEISKDNNRNPDTGEKESSKGVIQYKKPIGPKPQSEREKQKQWRKEEQERKRIEREETRERNKREWEEKRKQEDAERELKRRKEQSESATREAERIADRQSRDEWREIEKKNASKEPYKPKEIITGKSIAKKVGNVIVSGIKSIPTRMEGSGRRATLEYRRQNRQYASEARRMRSQVSSIGDFNAAMLGTPQTPTRSKYAGTHETGLVDPLSNWSSGIMGAGRVRQDSTMEGVASRMAGRKNPGRRPKKSTGDPLASLSRNLLGRG